MRAASSTLNGISCSRRLGLQHIEKADFPLNSMQSEQRDMTIGTEIIPPANGAYRPSTRNARNSRAPPGQVLPPKPLGRMARKLQEIASLPVERRPVDLYAALAEVAR